MDMAMDTGMDGMGRRTLSSPRRCIEVFLSV